MSKKIWVLTFSLYLITGLLLTACGGGNSQPADTADSEQPAQSEETASSEESAGEPVTIRVWAHQNEGFNKGLEAIADKYMAAHPNVTITLEVFDYDTYIQTLQTSIPAGTEADVMQLFGSWVCSYADNLAETPGDVITLDEAQEQIFAAQLGGYICDDKLYGIPEEFNIEYGAVLVNTRIAADAGIENITDGWESWDAFIADASAMTILQDGNMTRAGYNFTSSDAIPSTFYSLILQNGGQYLTDDGEFSVNTPEGEAALTFMMRLVDEGLVDPVLYNDESNWVGDSYFEETSAIGLVGPWVIPEYAGDFPEVAANTQYVHLPYFGDKPAFVAASGWGLTVSDNSEAQEAAWDFVKFAALDPENALSWNLSSGTLPALKANATGDGADNLTAEFPYFGPFLSILEYAQPEGAFPDRDLVWYEITYPNILNFLQGNLSMAETLAAIDREVNESR